MMPPGVWIDWLLHTPGAQAPVLFQLFPPAIALLGLLVAWRTAVWVARQKATLDLIEKRESTAYYRDNNRRFSELRRSGGLAALNNPQSAAEVDDRQRVIAYLNHYELVALGIRRGALSGGFYKRWMGGPFVRDWNAALDWIEGERWKHDPDTGVARYDAKVFGQFERVARRWSPKGARRPAGAAGVPPRARGGPSDEILPELEGVDPPHAAPQPAT